MSLHLELLALLQEAAVKMRRLARAQPSDISAELLRMADEIAAETAQLEAELIGDGLLDAGLTAADAGSRA